LARIIATCSNAGELVLDPFSGSGTTAAAAVQLGRDYCGIDISENYVENSKKRLAELKKQPSNKHGLTDEEYLELKRLFTEIGFDASQIIENEKLLNIFTRQYHLRMNNGKKYETGLIENALKDFLTWVKKR